uniref:Uncharacterized protein n=1 Tax=Psilocybe cubensis TaxID=181762 RepID=A0A8H7XS24_PSICU
MSSYQGITTPSASHALPKERHPASCVLNKACKYKMYGSVLFMKPLTKAQYYECRYQAILRHLRDCHGIDCTPGNTTRIQCLGCAMFGRETWVEQQNLARHINQDHQPPPYAIGYCPIDDNCPEMVYGDNLFAHIMSAEDMYVKRYGFFDTHTQNCHGMNCGGELRYFLCPDCQKVGKQVSIREDEYAQHYNTFHQPPPFAFDPKRR